MKLIKWSAMGSFFLGSFFLAALLSVPAWSTTTSARTAMPGTLNYVEGQAFIGDQVLKANSVGSAELAPGQTINTENGKAEVLLTPGVFLRLGSDSSATLVSPNLTDTKVQIAKGRAMVEVDELYKKNDIQIQEAGATTRLEKAGLYGFDADQKQVSVVDGKAEVLDGDQRVTVKGGHQVTLTDTAKLKAHKFDKKAYEDSDLYRWSSLRSQYLADANVEVAHLYVDNGWWGPGWASGWYWDPWFGGYTFLPANGIFYSPFGWGYYSPVVIYQNPGLYPWYPRYGVPNRYPGAAANRRVEPHIGGPAYRPAPTVPRNPAVMPRPAPEMRAPSPMARMGGGGFHGSGMPPASFGGRR